MNAVVDTANFVPAQVVTPAFEVENLQALIRNPEEFEKYFKKGAITDEMGKGFWTRDPRINGFRLVFPDGSYVRVKFFDTIKKIYNSKNVEVPGRESFLSYLDVTVMPAGMKGYEFICFQTQCVMAYAKGRRPAKELHAEAIAKIINIGAAFGIDLTDRNNWCEYFVKHFQKKDPK